MRRIIRIDAEKCNGCGACVAACHEGAIELIDGKAMLTREDYCDGLGDCLPTCPTGAITFEMREAPAYNEEAVRRAKEKHAGAVPTGCPGTRASFIRRDTEAIHQERAVGVSCLAQWPCQIRLVPVSAPYFEDANLLIAADCTAYAYAGFHQDFMRNHITLIGCPKLDAVDYTEKLTQILSHNRIKSLKVLRMEVPCCGGLEMAVRQALQKSNQWIPWQVITISTDGKMIED